MASKIASFSILNNGKQFSSKILVYPSLSFNSLKMPKKLLQNMHVLIVSQKNFDQSEIIERDANV